MVTRDAHSLDIEKWAETAAAGNIAAPSTVGLTQSEGYPSSYKTPSGDNPEMEIIQWLWRAWSGMLVEVNEWGCGLPWDDGIAYLQYALVLGSDGDHYVAVRANTNVNPTTDSNNSDWAPLVPAGGTTFDASAIVSGVFDVAHIPEPERKQDNDWNRERGPHFLRHRAAGQSDVHRQPARGYAIRPPMTIPALPPRPSRRTRLTGGRW